MAHLDRSVAALRISGDDLDPTEITKALGCEPTRGQRKGDVLTGKKTGISRTVKFGMWLLQANDREPEDLNGQIAELLDRLNPSLDVWASIALRYRMDLFCGLFMHESNEGAAISAASLAALGQRGIELSLDIYSPTAEELQAQRTYWEVRSTLELIAELIAQHDEELDVLGSVRFDDEEGLWAYLVSDELWGAAGSVADHALIRIPEARERLEQLLIRLGREQMSVSRVNVRTETWVAAFEKSQAVGLRK
jgi:hypothetical protein